MDDTHLDRSVFELATAALAVLSEDGRVLRMNRAARELPGIDVESLLAGRLPGADMAAFGARLRASGSASMTASVAGSDGRTHAVTIEARGPVVFVRDTTALRDAQEELARLRRLEWVDALAASAAHDFKNLLTVVTCSAAVLVRELDQHHGLLEVAREIQLATERATTMVRHVLSRLRRTAPSAPVDVNRALDELKPLIVRLAGDAVEVSMDLRASGQPSLDVEQLEHAVLNLVANARDAMPGGGRLTVATHDVELTSAVANVEGGHPHAGAYLALAVSDTGSGMTREVRERIFERGFTTKDRDQGSGLGLAMVRQFTTQSGGCFSVQSAPGSGTRIVLYFPCERAR